MPAHIMSNESSSSAQRLRTINAHHAQQQQLSTIQQIGAATSGAMITSLLVTPLDVVKTRIQVQTDVLLRHVCPAVCCEGPHAALGTRAMFKEIIRSDGLRGLWKGLQPTLLLQVPSTGVYYAGYDLFKHAFQQRFKDDGSISAYAPLVAGSSARFLTVLATCPLELVRTNIQAQDGASKGAIRILTSAVQHKGFSSLWTGLGPTILRDVPFSALYWFLYESFKSTSFFSTPISSSIDNSLVGNFGKHFLAGASAGAIAAALTNPIDVVKTRVQAELATTFRSTLVGTVKEVWRTEGYKGFAAGVVPRVMRVGPACAIMISSYELFKRLLVQEQ